VYRPVPAREEEQGLAAFWSAAIHRRFVFLCEEEKKETKRG
jgi:hypothetical protein